MYMAHISIQRDALNYTTTATSRAGVPRCSIIYEYKYVY